MKPRGGTEILNENLFKYVDASYFKNINLIVSRIGNLSNNKPNICWQHLNTDEEAVFALRNSDVVNLIDKHIFVSDWQRFKFCNEYKIPLEKTITIKNAIEPISFIEKPKSGKLQLIYTSTPWRGLDILIEAFKLLNRDDVELNVYSSTVIYGVNFLKNKFDWLFDKCRNTRNVKYFGYVTNKAVRAAVQKSHIFAYPSIFEETSCLAAIEAGAAGCKIVTTNYGALMETCEHWATYTNYDKNYQLLIQDYARALNSVIDGYWDNYHTLPQQSKYFNEKYSWENRKAEWITFLKQYA